MLRCSHCRRLINRADALSCPGCGSPDIEHFLPTEPAGKYSRPPFTEPQPRRRRSWGIGTMTFWLLVIWTAAVLAAILLGPNP